jgi:protein CLEC16A
VLHNTQKSLIFLLESAQNRSVLVQLLQTCTLLIHNLPQEAYQSYLLSSGLIRKVVVFPFSFDDEEIIDHYISFLKGMAVNLTQDQLIRFLLANNFSLFSSAMMFFHSKEYLIKTASRTVLLTVMRCK